MSMINVIAALLLACVFLTGTALVLPVAQGSALADVSLLLAVLVAVLCINGLMRHLRRR